MNIVDVLCIQHQMQQQQSDPGNGIQNASAGTPSADSTRTTSALNRSLNGKSDSFNDVSSGIGANTTKYQGFVAVLKENFGFIETIQHDEEVFILSI